MSKKKQVRSPIAQANVITSAKEDLSRDQRRVLYLYLRHVYREGFPDNGMLAIEAKEYADRFGLGINDAREDLRKAISGFRGKVVHIKHNDEEWDEYEWVIHRGARKRGVYLLSINPLLKPYLDVFTSDNSQLRYTLLSLDYASNLKSKWGQRLYQSLCQWRTTGEFKIKLSELIDSWMIPSGYKGRWPDIRRYVIEAAVGDVRANTELKTLTYVPKMGGSRNAVTALLFLFDKNTD